MYHHHPRHHHHLTRSHSHNSNSNYQRDTRSTIPPRVPPARAAHLTRGSHDYPSRRVLLPSQQDPPVLPPGQTDDIQIEPSAPRPYVLRSTPTPIPSDSFLLVYTTKRAVKVFTLTVASSATDLSLCFYLRLHKLLTVHEFNITFGLLSRLFTCTNCDLQFSYFLSSCLRAQPEFRLTATAACLRKPQRLLVLERPRPQSRNHALRSPQQPQDARRLLSREISRTMAVLCCCLPFRRAQMPDLALSLVSSANTFLNGTLVDRETRKAVYTIDTLESRTAITRQTAPTAAHRGRDARTRARSHTGAGGASAHHERALVASVQWPERSPHIVPLRPGAPRTRSAPTPQRRRDQDSARVHLDDGTVLPLPRFLKRRSQALYVSFPFRPFVFLSSFSVPIGVGLGCWLIILRCAKLLHPTPAITTDVQFHIHIRVYVYDHIQRRHVSQVSHPRLPSDL